jgi:Tfp pilus assembly protein PilZ
MAKILIHGTNTETVKDIGEKLNIHYFQDSILTSLDLEKTIEIVNEQTLHLLIYESEYYTDKELQLFKDFRRWGLCFPVLFISNDVLASDLNLLKNEKKPYFLESNYDDKILIDMVKKLVKLKETSQKKRLRYSTNQLVVVESLQKGIVIESNMYNLSNGGAYCEFDFVEDINVSIGDIVKLSVPVSYSTKKHALNAKIVWTTTQGNYSGRYGFGLKFINNEEVYRSLFGKLV